MFVAVVATMFGHRVRGSTCHTAAEASCVRRERRRVPESPGTQSFVLGMTRTCCCGNELSDPRETQEIRIELRIVEMLSRVCARATPQGKSRRFGCSVFPFQQYDYENRSQDPIPITRRNM